MTETNERTTLYEDSDYQYNRDVDGGNYAVNKSTGEIVDAFYALLPVGSNIYTPEQQKRYKEQKDKEIALHRQKDANRPLGKFFFVPNNEVFEDLTPETATRLIFLNTFIDYAKGNVLMLSKNKPMRKKDLQSVLKVSRATADRFWLEVSPKYIHKTEDDFIASNKNIFRMGSLPKKNTEQWQTYRKIFIKGVQTLYRQVKEPSKHKHLGYLFKMLPFVNIENNVLCTDIFEPDMYKIQPLTISDFCNIIGYDYSKVSRLLKIYKELLFDIDGHKERFCSFNFDGVDKSAMGIYVNPNILYSGSNYKNVEILGALCCEKEKPNDTTNK